jgi:hypothetical protein
VLGFDAAELIVALIASAVGFIYFQYGRKQAQINLIVCGIALMVYPYVVSSAWVSAVVGGVIAAVPFTVWRPR